MAPFSFRIKLATLASKKELVDLDKWLSNNIIAHKDNFFEVYSDGTCRPAKCSADVDILHVRARTHTH